MTEPIAPRLLESIEASYNCGYACHGDLDLTPGEYSISLVAVIRKHTGDILQQVNLFDCFVRLHTDDLYLAFACSSPSQVAWVRFYGLYLSHVTDLARFASPTADAGAELASCVLSCLFLPDSSGRSHIASYDGQNTLASWLRMIVARRAINEYKRKWNKLERIDITSEIVDEMAVERIEAGLRARRYDEIVKESYKTVSQHLTERERLIMIMLYEEGRSALEVSRLVGVHPSTISRQVRQIYKKLRRDIVSCLESRYGLSEAAVSECLADMVDNPSHSLLAYLRLA
jgi:RNA polymerase sigma-70 factor